MSPTTNSGPPGQNTGSLTTKPILAGRKARFFYVLALAPAFQQSPTDSPASGTSVPGLRRAWARDKGCKSPTNPTGGNWKHMQLHECQEVSGFGHVSARTCGVEANCKLQHRMKMNSRKAGRPGSACPRTLRPISSRGRQVVGAAAAGSLGLLPRESSSGPPKW